MALIRNLFKKNFAAVWQGDITEGAA